MFQWSITLSDKQVAMLVAFHMADDDADKSRFTAVHAMIGDAWDVRAVRKLSEMGLLLVEPVISTTAGKSNRWNITDKGNLIAAAILEDADALKMIGERPGLKMRHAINEQSHQEWVEKTRAKKVA